MSTPRAAKPIALRATRMLATEAMRLKLVSGQRGTRLPLVARQTEREE